MQNLIEIVRVVFNIWTKNIKNAPKMGFFPHLRPPRFFFLKKTFELQVTIPSAHPVQISSRSDYCITLS